MQRWRIEDASVQLYSLRQNACLTTASASASPMMICSDRGLADLHHPVHYRSVWFYCICTLQATSLYWHGTTYFKFKKTGSDWACVSLMCQLSEEPCIYSLYLTLERSMWYLCLNGKTEQSNDLIEISLLAAATAWLFDCLFVFLF